MRATTLIIAAGALALAVLVVVSMSSVDIAKWYYEKSNFTAGGGPQPLGDIYSEEKQAVY